MRVVRGNLLLLGVSVGVAIGLICGWVIYPRAVGLVSPEGLRQDYQETYMVMVAAAHNGNGDVERARVRLDALGLRDPLQSITALAQRSAAQGRAPFDVAVLGELALVLSKDELPSAAAEAPTSMPTLDTEATVFPEPTDVIPTIMPTAVNTNEYTLIVREAICDQELDAPLLQIQVDDAAGNPLSGVRLMVEWSSGNDIFATGFFPEVGPGYADFAMRSGETYSLQVGGHSTVVRGLKSDECRAENGVVFAGSVFLRWQRAG